MWVLKLAAACAACAVKLPACRPPTPTPTPRPFQPKPFQSQSQSQVNTQPSPHPPFAAGAVKITPAHDPNDFRTGKRPNLEFINILDDSGCIGSNGTGPFAGQPRFQARLTVADYLREKGLFRGSADNPMRLGLCSR